MLRNKKGQTLVEYLIIVALIAVGSIAILRSLSETIQVRFANITNALQNKESNFKSSEVSSEMYKKRGLDNFFEGAADSSGTAPGGR